MSEQFANAAQSTLAFAIGTGNTTLTVVSSGAFPPTSTFRILIDAEIMTVTAVSGTTFTVTRASEAYAGTQVAATHALGAKVTHILTSGSLESLRDDNIVCSADNAVGFSVTAHSPFQTADPFQIRNSSGGVLASFSPDGQFFEVPVPLGFGAGVGYLVHNFGGDDVSSAEPILLANSKIVGCGFSTSGLGEATFFGFNADGSVDSSFGTDGLLLMDDGGLGTFLGEQKIYPGGRIAAVGGTTDELGFWVVRINMDGTPDSSFGSNGRVATTVSSLFGYAEDLAVQADGKIVVVGFDNTSGNDYRWVIIRYNVDGSLDSSFGSSGRVNIDWGVDDDEARAVIVQSDGKIVVAGFKTDVGSGRTVQALCRLNTDGTLDSSFGTAGKVTTDTGSGGFTRKAALQSSGKIIAGGDDSNIFHIMRYTTGGVLDATFGTAGIATYNFNPTFTEFLSFSIQEDDKILVCGDSGSSPRQWQLMRFNANGSVDTGFGVLGTGIVHLQPEAPSSEANGLTLYSDGRILVAGSTHGVPRNIGLARFLPDGTLDGVIPPVRKCPADTTVGLTIVAHSPTQSANLQEWQDSTGVVQGSIGANGFLPVRMTTVQKNAISSPAEGLMIYDTTLHKLCVRTASTWETITSS